MDEMLFVFASFTYAAKAKKLLLRMGIAASQKKISREDGCQHAVAVPRSDFFKAVRTLREGGVDYTVSGS